MMKDLRRTLLSLIALARLAFTAPKCLPLTTNTNLCAVSPGIMASDGFDDVCNLVACCKDPIPNSITLQQAKTVVTCSNVDCTNVCNLSLDRVTYNQGSEACNDICYPPPPRALGNWYFEFSGGICAGVDIESNGQLKYSVTPNLGVSFSPGVSCEPNIPVKGNDVKIPNPGGKLPWPTSIGKAFCCGISLNNQGECKLECSDDTSFGIGHGGCSFSGPLWEAPCSAIEGFDDIYRQVVPAIDGILPPTLCTGRCCADPTNCGPSGCRNLPTFGHDANQHPICNLLPEMLKVDTVCSSKLFSCCDGGFCKPWCFVLHPAISPDSCFM